MTPAQGITFHVLEVPDAFRERSRIRHWLKAVARAEGRRIVSLEYVLMDDEALLRINRSHLGHDDYTDVITFPYAEGNDIEGEVLISHDRVKENARTFGVPTSHELRRVMVHGLLHLCGYRDGTLAERNTMRALEDEYLGNWR
jgi:probable rRNA maturation factor